MLSWFENLQDEERPPEYLWEDREGLEQWWESVEAKRKAEMDTGRGSTDQAQNDPGAEMTENDHARFLRQAVS